VHRTADGEYADNIESFDSGSATKAKRDGAAASGPSSRERRTPQYKQTKITVKANADEFGEDDIERAIKASLKDQEILEKRRY
jgi:hypothetical protein